MSIPIDELEVQVQTSAESASGGLDSLIESLDSLKRAVKGGAGLTTVTKQLSTLNTALSGFDSQNVGKIREIANGLKDLSSIGTVNIPKNLSSQIQSIGNATNSLSKSGLAKIGTMVDSLNMISRVKPSNLASAVNALNKLPSALQGIQNFGTSNVGSEIQSLVSALSPLGQMDKSALGSYISQLRKLPEVMEQLKSIDMGLLASQVKEVANSFAPLAKEMQSIANGFSALPSRIQTLIKSTDKLPEVNNRTAKSYVNLAAKMTIILYTVQRVTSVLASWITESNKYVEDMNLFSVSMGQYADEAMKYADTVSSIMGIDPAEWMRNQGIFMTLATGFGVVSERAYIMSQNLTQLGYDLASFFNISYTDAFAKLQSGLAGELEPLRRIGFDLSVARLQQEAYALGIEKSVNAMTQAEKAELRYYAIMTQVTTAQGDMARTLEAPANQLRVLRAAVTQAARALGNIFIPIINIVLPYAIALANVVRMLADALASFFGFTLPEVDYSGIENAATGAGDLSDNLGDAAGNAQDLKKSLLGIDELNLLSAPSDAGGGAGGAGVGGGGGLGFELPTYDFIGDAVIGKVSKLVESFKEWLPLIGAVGAAFATWGFTNWIAGLLGVSDVLGALVLKDYFTIFAGLLLTAAGAVFYFSGAVDALTNGMDSVNLTRMLIGIAGAVSGVYLALKPLSSTLAPLASMITLAASSFGLLSISLSDMGDNGVKIENLLGAFAGLSGVVYGLSKAFKSSTKVFAPFVAPIAAFVGSISILQKTVSSIIIDGANAVNVIGAIASAIAAVTAAVWLWNTASAANPILAIAVIAIGVISAIKGITDAVKESAEAAYQASDDYAVMQNILERTQDISERATQSLTTMRDSIDSLNTVSNDYAAASVLVDEIFDINEKANASNYELELMRVKVDILNGMGIEGLTLSIDETTGRIIQTREEVEKLIASLEQEARMEAMREVLVEVYKNQYSALVDAKQALSDYQIASQQVDETTNKLIDSYWKFGSEAAYLETQLETQTQAMESAKQAYSDAINLYTESTTAANSYSEELINLKTAESGVGDGVVQGLDDTFTALEEAASNVGIYGNNISQGIVQGIDEGLGEEQTKSIWSKIGDWFKEVFGIHSPSTVFAEYGSYLMQGLANGMSTDSSLYTAIRNVGNEILSEFQSNVSYSNFYTLANNAIAGFSNGIGQLYTLSYNAVSNWANSIIDWFKGILGIHSPSRVFGEMAQFSVQGYNESFTKEGKTTRGIVEGWAESFSNVTPSVNFKSEVSATPYTDDEFTKTFYANVSAKGTIAMEDVNDEFERSNAEQNALLREQNALLREMLESGRDIILDGKSVAKEVTKYQRQMSRAMGV